VEFVPEASARWDVLEVRAHDMPALLHRVSGALTDAGISIQAARVATLGSEVVDVFYVSEPAGTPLTDERRAQARGAVFAALAPTTL
jgi:[protein-PII] uridylyltransferase